MILQRSTNIEHFTALHLDKWICCAARLPHLNVPRHFAQTHFLFKNLYFPQRQEEEEEEKNTKVESRIKEKGWGVAVMNGGVKRSDLTLR